MAGIYVGARKRAYLYPTQSTSLLLRTSSEPGPYFILSTVLGGSIHYEFKYRLNKMVKTVEVDT